MDVQSDRNLQRYHKTWCWTWRRDLLFSRIFRREDILTMFVILLFMCLKHPSSVLLYYNYTVEKLERWTLEHFLTKVVHTNKTQLTLGRSADQLFFFSVLGDKAEKVSSCLHSACSDTQDQLFHTRRTKAARSLFTKSNKYENIIRNTETQTGRTETF